MKRCGLRRGPPLGGLAAALCLLMFSPAMAAEPAYSSQAVAKERAGIAEHRRLMLKILAEEEAACRERFAVTACLDDVQRRRRDALAPLRERELRLDESERRARAEERRRAVAAKLAAAASTPPASPGSSARAAQAAPASGSAADATRTAASVSASAAAPSVASRPAPILRVRRAAGSASATAARDAEASERVRDAERRREQTEVVRERIERRQAEREAAGRRSDPLPRPGAASLPAR